MADFYFDLSDPLLIRLWEQALDDELRAAGFTIPRRAEERDWLEWFEEHWDDNDLFLLVSQRIEAYSAQEDLSF